MKSMILTLALTFVANACGEHSQGDAASAPDEAASSFNAGRGSAAASPVMTEEEKIVAQAHAEELAAAADAAAERRRTRVKTFFSRVMKPLTEASDAYQKHEDLPRDKWFSEDQAGNMEHINELLDDAMEALGVSELSTARSELRGLREEIGRHRSDVLDIREKRLGAPKAADLGSIERVYTTSVEDYDERLLAAQEGIAAKTARISELESVFVQEMRSIGIDIDLESARALLSTVTGDDFVDMCVIFDNVRGMTEQLEELTSESGESLEAAKRYYGTYVVLIRLMDRIQKEFVTRTRDVMIPKLERLAGKAQEIIRDAERNMRSGGTPEIAQQNIQSNELTIQATGLYIDYLRVQASEIEARNQALQITLRDALNTYDTVSLSSQVASVLREGQRNFEALLELDMPSLRGFENSELKAEFERLTRDMTRID